MDINIRVCGEAGQGVQTTGSLLTHALAAAGLHVYATQGYMSRIRGGINNFDVRASDAELFSSREMAEVVVALTGEALDAHASGLIEGGVILYDGEDDRRGVIALDMTDAAKEAGGTPVMVNSVAAGAVFALLGYEPEALHRAIAAQFGKKGEKLIAANIACTEAGAALMAASDLALGAPEPGEPTGVVTSGAEAAGLSAAVSGVKVVASYPMTPSTATFTFLAGHADEYGIVVEQAEDEIAAINMICGATYAGVPAMTTTSDGGFALMNEGLSLAGMLECPVFVLVAQRPAPATGLPTRTGQECLKFAIHAGHGEFPRAIYAPGTIEQSYALTRRALETAHRYQTPAILLTDQYLQDLQKNVLAMPAEPDPIDRRILRNPPADYRRYAVTENGVSPRALPGSGPFIVVDSDEHTDDGHITEDLSARVELQDKRMRKGKGLEAEALPPEVFQGPADEVLLCWGSTYGPCREAVELLRADGRGVCMVHFAQVWPVNVEEAARALSGRRVTAVEGNSSAQFASMLRQLGVIPEYEAILRYDGLPFTGEWIAGRVTR